MYGGDVKIIRQGVILAIKIFNFRLNSKMGETLIVYTFTINKGS